jgi:hypothetical protein
METPLPGIRINSIPQLGGTSTTQQAIYLTHNNPCGINSLLNNLMGETGLTFQQLADLLTKGMNDEGSTEALNVLVNVFNTFNSEPTLQNQYNIYDKYFKYGQKLWEFFSTIDIPGYKTNLTIYDDNGRIMFDSGYTKWPLVIETTEGIYEPLKLRLVDTTPYSITLPIPVFPFSYTLSQIFNPTGSNECFLFNLLKTPSFWPFILNTIHPISGETQLEIVNSPWMINQNQMFESTMAIASLLTDPANTRTYSALRFGFSARPVLPGSGQIGYFGCFLQEIYSKTDDFLIESFFVRLGFIREISSP